MAIQRNAGGPLTTAFLFNEDICDTKMKGGHSCAVLGPHDTKPSLAVEIRQYAQTLHWECTRCRACVTQCAFLQKNGALGDIGASLLAGNSTVDPFECSLCNLCTAVCPAQIAPGAFFLEMRRQIVARDQLPAKRYATILGYERRSSSRLFSWYGLPTGCDTVFFPGCTLPGTRAETTWQIYQQLNKQIPHLGVVLDCCHKPSHDLGQQQSFLTRFEAMQEWLIRHGVRHIIVACPNCYKIFHGYGQGLTVRTAWEILAETPIGSIPPAISRGRITIHDPCPLRNHEDVHQAVRTIVHRLGLEVREVRHFRKRAICCGEGGSVEVINLPLAKKWGDIRKIEAGDDIIITYCAGCADFLARAGMKVVHLGDLLVNPEQALTGKASVTRAPWTYLNRIRLKRRLQKAIATRHEKSQREE